jgi:eukaryotic-like serine/threonine-protein kinase
MMSQDRRAQIEGVFEAALECPEAERAGWLEAECGADLELLTEVQALLAAHALADRLFGERSEQPEGGRVGPYRLIRELGRGGMGVVYLAERADGQFRRRVAIKVVGTRDAADPVYQRFLGERQILAGLDHPNIARLLDGGLTEDGRPYLVLEYVEGLPITTYCDRHRLGIEERLRLLVEVCEAVQHAHQNLVIHRDLKPSNILVTAAGQVRLLDFGIAKLLNPALSSAHSPATRIDLRVMTPEYASPEQVRGDALTTASDIYSLGVLLYELLTGSRPYHLEHSSPAEIMATVCERDPDRPSTRVIRAETLAVGDGGAAPDPHARAAARHTSVERLRRRLRGDLDSITMMAMRKEAGRRYASPALLAQDLRRHLDGEPVLAHRGSHRYRVARFVGRHRTVATAAILVLLSLSGGLGAAVWQAALAERERARAESAREAAETALAQSEEVTDFLMGLFQSGDGDGIPAGEEVTARDLLRRGAAGADELADHPDVQARMLDVIGRMYLQLGRYDEALRLLERAVAIRRDVLGPRSLELASSLIHLSWVHRGRGTTGEAWNLATEALSIRRAVLPPDHPEISDAVYQVGRATPARAEAEALYREALEILQRTGSNLERQVGLVQGLATFARRAGRGEDAVALDRAALELAREAFGPEDHRTGYAMVHLGDQVRDVEGDVAEAERLYRQGLELISRRFGEHHLNLIHGLGSLAWLKTQTGDHEAAEQLYRRTLAIRMSAIGAEHPATASSLSILAMVLERQGRLDEAEALARAALGIYDRALGPDHWGAGRTLIRLGSVLHRKGRVAEADSLYRKAVALQLRRSDGKVSEAEVRRDYGRLLIARREWQAAEDQLLESHRLLEGEVAASHPNLHETKRALTELYLAWGRPDEAERYRVPPGRFIAY